MNRIPIRALVGPTAGGKTAFALAYAASRPVEIVLCDSMQIYRDMPIGTAAPTAEEQASVPHRLCGTLDPKVPFSVGEYVTLASREIGQIRERGKIPLLVGGTGLYLDRLLWGGVSGPEIRDEAFRREAEAFADRNGNEALHRRLAEVDPEAAATIHPNNRKRVIRALELYRLTGTTKTRWDEKSRENFAESDARVVCLDYHSRETLRARIRERVDRMLGEGLLEETEALLRAGVFESNATAAQAIGYKEMLPCLTGQASLEECRERLILSTGQYAKRQQTWFRAKSYIRFVYADREDGTLRERPDVERDIEQIFDGGSGT